MALGTAVQKVLVRNFFSFLGNLEQFQTLYHLLFGCRHLLAKLEWMISPVPVLRVSGDDIAHLDPHLGLVK